MKKIISFFIILSVLFCCTSCGFLFKNEEPHNPQYIQTLGISLNQTNFTGNKGDTYLLSATIAPLNATNQSVSWSSDDPTVASVSSIGLVELLNIGETIITATSAEGQKAYCYVKVVPVFKTFSLTMQNWKDYLILDWVDDESSAYMKFSLNEEFKNADLSEVYITYKTTTHVWDGTSVAYWEEEKNQLAGTKILIYNNPIYVYERYYIVTGITGTITYPVDE